MIPNIICSTFQPIIDFCLWPGCCDSTETDPPSCLSTLGGAICRSKTLFFDFNPKGGKTLDFQTPPPAPDKLSDPNLTPLSTHPGMKYFRKGNPVFITTVLPLFITRSSGPRFARPSLLPRFVGPFWIFYNPFCVRRGLKMILSHIAPSCLSMSSYRAIWTHFRSNSIIVYT